MFAPTHKLQKTYASAVLGFMLQLSQPAFTKDFELPPVKTFPKAFEEKDDPSIFDITQDQRGIMYFATQKGVLEFDGLSWRNIPTPARVNSIAIRPFDNRVYVAGEGFIGYLGADPNGYLEFINLNEAFSELNTELSQSSFISVRSTQATVAFATETKIYVYHDGKINNIAAPSLIYALFTVRNSLFIVDEQKGLFRIDHDLKLQPITDIFRAQSIVALNEQKIAVASYSHGILLVTFDQDFKPTTEQLLEQDYSYFGSNPTLSLAVHPHAYFAGNDADGLVALDNNGHMQNIPADIKDSIGSPIRSVFVDRDARLWVGGKNGIVFFDTANIVQENPTNTTSPIKIKSYVRSIETINGQNKLYGGSIPRMVDKKQSVLEPKQDLRDLILSSSMNALRIDYSADHVGVNDGFQYQTMLEGYDKDWSEWSERRSREFTNLYWQSYVFKVRAKSPDGTVSEEGQYAFTIDPPWHESKAFYAFQIFCLFILMCTVVYFRLRDIHKWLENPINGVVVSTVFGVIFTKVGGDRAVSSVSGDAAVLSIFISAILSIFLTPLQAKLEIFIEFVEKKMEIFSRKSKVTTKLLKIENHSSALNKNSYSSSPDESDHKNNAA